MLKAGISAKLNSKVSPSKSSKSDIFDENWWFDTISYILS